MAENSAAFGFEFTIKGDEAVVRSLMDMEKRVQGLEAAQNKAATSGAAPMAASLNRVTAAAGRTSSAVAQNAARMTALTGVVGSAIPALGGFGRAASIAGTAISAMSAATGPWGIAIGVVIGLLPTVIGLITDLTKEAAESKRGIGEVEGAILDYVSTLEANVGKVQQLHRIIMGLGTAIQTQAVITRLRENFVAADDALTGAIDALSHREQMLIRGTAIHIGETEEQFARRLQDLTNIEIGYLRQVAAARFELQEIQRQLGQAATGAAAIEEGGTIAEANADLSARGRGRARRPEVVDELADELRLKNDLIAINQKRAESEIAALDAVTERKLALIEIEMKLAEESADRYARSLGEKEAANASFLEGQRATMDEISAGWDMAAGATMQMVEMMASGERGATAALLKQIAIRNALLGAERLAYGIFATVWEPPLAAAAFTASAQHFAVAAAAGAGAGVATLAGDTPRPAASSGGGGSSGGGIPPRASGGDSGSSGGGTVVINFNSPADEASIGRMVNKARRAAARRGW